MTIAHGLRAIVVAITALLGSVRVARAQDCIVTDGVLVGPVGKERTLTIVPSDLRSGPALGTPVPMKLSSASGCEMHVTPAPEMTRFVATFRVQLSNATAADSLRFQLVAVDSNAADVSMSSQRVLPGGSVPAEFTLRPRSSGARAVRVAIAVVVDSTRASIQFPFTIVWAPLPALRLSTGRTDCGAPVCVFAKVPEDVSIVGDDAADIDPRGQVVVRLGNAVVPQCCQLSRGPLGPFFPLVVDKEGTQPLGVTVPLLVPRVRIDAAGTPQLVSTVDVTYPVRAEGLGAVQVHAQPFATTAAGRRQQLKVLRGRTQGIAVELVLHGGAAKVKLVRDSLGARAGHLVDFHEAMAGASGATVAQLYVQSVSDTSVTGILKPVAATRPVTANDVAPELVANVGGTEVHTSVVVLPETKIQQYFVRRRRQGEVRAGSVLPDDTARVRLEGPAVGYLVSGEFEGERAEVRGFGGRDSALVSFRVSRDAPRVGRLVLRDADSAETVLDIPVALPQRPVTDLGFVSLEYTGSDKRRQANALSWQPSRSSGVLGALPSAFRPPFVARGALRDTSLEVRSLGDVVLRFNRSAIDRGRLHGVQYLTLDVRLFDPEGNDHGHVTKCLAIVPPPLEAGVYANDGKNSCEAVASSQLSISDLVEESHRAPARSTLRLSIRPEVSHYDGEDVDLSTDIELQKRGWYILEPKANLPAPAIAFRRGKTTPGVTYAGAVFHFMPVLPNGLLNDLFNSAHSLALEAGAVMGSLPQNTSSTSGLDARLSLVTGVSYVFRSMKRNEVTLSFFGGRVYPVSGRGVRPRDSYWAFRPGFDVPIGGGKPGS